MLLPEPVQAFVDAEIAANETDFSDLRAVYLNGTLKPSPAPSNTDGLIEVSAHVLCRCRGPGRHHPAGGPHHSARCGPGHA